jgi:adenylate cyclase class 2
MKDIEIEIQALVERSEALKGFLEEKAQFVSEKRQVDQYFIPAHEDFTKADPIQKWLRLRSEEDIATINYKYWHYENGIGQYADEFESKIDDKESLEKILNALDCKPLVTVDKTRRKYNYEDYEVGLDTVVGLGEFVEIEYKGKDGADHKKITQEMIDFLQSQDCGKIRLNNGGYPYMLLFPEKTNYIDVE